MLLRPSRTGERFTGGKFWHKGVILPHALSADAADHPPIEIGVSARGHPSRAPDMQRYMKSSIPYYGVPAPALRQVCRKCFADLSLEDAEAWRESVLHIFRNARFREERYAAVELCLWKKARDFQTSEALPIYEEMIVEAAWWDIVDTLAAHGVGKLLRNDPKPIAGKMRLWSRSDNIWKRRTSILCQLSFKRETDLALLYSCIEPSLSSKDSSCAKRSGGLCGNTHGLIPLKSAVTSTRSKCATESADKTSSEEHWGFESSFGVRLLEPLILKCN